MNEKDKNFIHDRLVNFPLEWQPHPEPGMEDYYILPIKSQDLMNWKRLDAAGLFKTSIMEFKENRRIDFKIEYDYDLEGHKIWFPMKFDRQESGKLEFLGEHARVVIHKNELLRLTDPSHNPIILEHRLPLMEQRLKALYWQPDTRAESLHSQFAIIHKSDLPLLGEDIWTHQPQLREWFDLKSLHVTKEKIDEKLAVNTTVYKIFLDDADAEKLGVSINSKIGHKK